MQEHTGSQYMAQKQRLVEVRADFEQTIVYKAMHM